MAFFPQHTDLPHVWVLATVPAFHYHCRVYNVQLLGTALRDVGVSEKLCGPGRQAVWQGMPARLVLERRQPVLTFREI